MLKKSDRYWNKVRKLVDKDNMNLEKEQNVVKVEGDYAIWEWRNWYFVFPTVEGIDFNSLPETKSGEGYPKISITQLGKNPPNIICWSAEKAPELNNVKLSHGVKLGWMIDLNVIDIEKEIIKGLI